MNQSLKNLKNQATSYLYAGVFGSVTPPAGVADYNAKAGASNIGLILFASNVLRFFTVIVGLVIVYNFILAGSDYITHPGDTGMHAKVKDRLTMSMIGLVIIVAAYTIAAIIGLLFFGDAGFILSPVIYGPQ